MPGGLKLNFDAAFVDGNTFTGVLLRNDRGLILGAWVNHFESDNPFCAETEAALQALHIANELQLEAVTIEGDAFCVIMALNGLDDCGLARDHSYTLWPCFDSTKNYLATCFCS